MNEINIKNCSVETSGIGRRAYLNSPSGRAALLADCTAHGAMDVYAEVMAVWGENPTVPDEPLPPEPTLEEVRENKLNELAYSFNERVSGSVTTAGGYTMQFDTTDAIKMEGAIKLLEATGATEGYLTQADDTTIYNVPLDTMKAVLIEMMSAFAACHARKQELRAAIKAAKAVEELGAITITWPV